MPTKFHPYHIVTNRPWPLVCSFMAAFLAFSLNWNLFFNFNFFLVLVNLILATIAFLWWKDVTREATFQGYHFEDVIKGLKLGMILFITSEVIFFSSFFWRFFHFSLRPRVELGQVWPPVSITRFNPLNVPLLNTIILISSGASITWAHHSLNRNIIKNCRTGLTITWILGIYFSFLQYIEYNQAEFNISDSSYGNIFYIATGFHGIHVLVGSIFLIFTDLFIKTITASYNHFLMIDLAAWYWHFVDVVWLFLYICLYWWGG